MAAIGSGERFAAAVAGKVRTEFAAAAAPVDEEATMSGAEIPPLSIEPEFCVVSLQNDSFGCAPMWCYAGRSVSFGDALPADQRANGARELHRVPAAR